MKKKHLTKILGCTFALGLLLTGCATVSNVHNASNEILYHGGSAVTVEGYTYFANGYTPYTSTTEFDYGSNAKVSFLARVEKDKIKTEGKDFSPTNVEKVKGKVAGYQNQDVFVLGDYIYFTSMNQHGYGVPASNDYSLVTLFRCRLNGDGLTELYTTEYFTGGTFCPVGDAENGYYWICYTGAYTSGKEFSGQIFSIKLGSSLGSKTLIADHVLSASFANANEDGALDRIFFTKSEEDGERTVINTYSTNYDGSDQQKYQTSQQINFIQKIEDRVFFTIGAQSTSSSGSTSSIVKTYYRDVKGITENENFENKNYTFATGDAITKIWLVAGEEGNDADKGYAFTASGSIVYVSSSTMRAEPGIIPLQVNLTPAADVSKILFVDNMYIYYSTSSAIMRVADRPEPGQQQIQPQTVIAMDSIVTEQFGFDGEYVYFYAPLASDVEINEEVETDEHNYAYRIKKEGAANGNEYQLIGKTLQKRTKKQED